MQVAFRVLALDDLHLTEAGAELVDRTERMLQVARVALAGLDENIAGHGALGIEAEQGVHGNRRSAVCSESGPLAAVPSLGRSAEDWSSFMTPVAL